MKIFGRSLNLPVGVEFPLLFIILYLPSYLNQGTGFPPEMFDYFSVHIQMILLSVLYSLFILYLLSHLPQNSKEELPDILGFIHSRQVLIALGGLVLLYGAVSVSSFYLPAQDTPILITKGYMLIPTALTCLFSAAQEELFFRVYGYTRLRQSGVSPRTSMIAMSLLFCAGHAYEGVQALFFSFAAGLFLTYLIRRGVSAFSLIPAHGLFNFSLILINYLSGGIFP